MAEKTIELYTGGYFQTNGYVVPSGENQVIVIDAPEGITEWILANGWEVTALLLTHLHYDHVIDVAPIKAAFPGALVASHSQPNDDLTLKTVLTQTVGWDYNVPEFSVDHTLEGEETVEIGGTTFRLLHVPGHSPDSLAFFFEETGQLFGGDVLFAGGIGRTDFPHGDHELLLSGIREKVYALPDSTTVYPGHGPETTVGMEKRTNGFVRVPTA